MPMLIRRHCHCLRARLHCRLRRFSSDQRGVVVLLVALALPVLAGTMGLAAEISYWYLHQRSMQNAADAAAIAAATNGSSTYAAEAAAVATQYGFTSGSGNITVTAANPGTAAGCTANCYTVTVSDKVPLFLSQIIGYAGNATVNKQGMTALSATAVTTGVPVSGHPYCILALASSGAQGITSNGAPKANLNGCDIMSNASATCNGHNLGATIGDAHGTNSGCGITQNSNVPAVSDPYSRLTSNIPANTCSSYPQEPGKKGTPFPASNQLTGSLSWSGNVIMCGDVQLTGNTTISAPSNAVLVIENGLLDTGSYTLQTTSGSGLTIVFAGTNGATYTGTTSPCQHYPTGSGTLNIAAPTSGPWTGIAIYQHPNLTDNGGDLDISAAGNSPTWNITGLVYLPHASVTFSGAVNKSSNGASCFGIVVDNITINGTGDTFANDTQCSSAGLTLPQSVSGYRGTLVN
jgi:Flp pilus assembly protein TadG